MSFSFGFFNENEDTNGAMGVVAQPTTSGTFEPVVQHPPLSIFQEGGDIELTTLQIGDVELFKAVVPDTESALDKVSDIIPGVYEGGYKVWECSVDLTALLLQNQCNLPDLTSCRAIELGCGHGFPGVAALRLGCTKVVFSDLNAEVINTVTWPNIYANCKANMHRAECFSGDWDELSDVLLCRTANGGDDGKFDLILSAETLYTEVSCNKLLAMVMKHLSTTGMALIASKRFYFGVGGGTYTLESLVAAGGALDYEVMQVYQDGASNIREIVRLTRK